MAQDPEPEEEQTEVQINPSRELDMVPLFASQTVLAEMEADVIKSVLDAHGFPSMIVGASPYPSLGFEVMVPRAMVEEARRAIEEQRKAGPQAAAEAEAAGEENT